MTGVLAFHRAGIGAGVVEQMRSQRPLALAYGPPAGIHVEVLNWRALAQAIHPETHRPFIVPSPFPYLPSTAQELARAYLEVVGVAPADSYSTQVTEDEARDIRGTGTKFGMSYSRNRGWAAYQRDVLQASLANGTGAWRPIEEPHWVDGPGTGRKFLRAVERVADFVDMGESTSPFEKIAPHRYCWPPVSGR